MDSENIYRLRSLNTWLYYSNVVHVLNTRTDCGRIHSAANLVQRLQGMVTSNHKHKSHRYLQVKCAARRDVASLRM